MAAAFFHIKALEFEQANARGNLLCANLPSMTAVVGFVHNLERHMRADGIEVNLDGVVIGYSELEPELGRARFPNDKKGQPRPMQPDYKLRGVADLLVPAVFSGSLVDPEARMERAVERARRFAGGEIVDFEVHFHERAEIADLVAEASFGTYWLVDRHELLDTIRETARENDTRPWQAFVEIFRLRKRPTHYYEGTGNKREKVELDNPFEWLEELLDAQPHFYPDRRVPVAIGYRPLTKKPTQTTNGYPHFLAEPLSGLAQWVPTYQLSRSIAVHGHEIVEEGLVWFAEADDDHVFKVRSDGSLPLVPSETDTFDDGKDTQSDSSNHASQSNSNSTMEKDNE